MAKELYNEKIDKNIDWGGDDSTGNLPVAGARVQEFIKETFGKRVGYLYRTPEQEVDNTYHLYGFADEASFNEWQNDKETFSDNVIANVSLPSGGGGTMASYVLGLFTASSQTNIVTIDNRVVLKLRFTSQEFNPITQQTIDTGETGTLVVQRRTSSSAQWSTVGTVTNIPSIPAANEDEYADIDISDMLSDGTQQVRVYITGDTTNTNTRYVQFSSITKTALSLEFATQWWLPITEEYMSLSYYIRGAVAKTLNLRIDGQRTVTRDLGTATYTETPFSLNVSDTGSDTVKVMTHGVHTVEAWISVTSDSSIQSKHVTSQVMVLRDELDTTPYLLLNDLKTDVTNWTQESMFTYALYNPADDEMDIEFVMYDYAREVEYMRTVRSVLPNIKNLFSAMFEVESDIAELTAYLEAFGDNNVPLISGREVFVVDNSLPLAPTSGADFILNPKMRSNDESNPATVINAATGAVVPATFNGFGFIKDGWVEDEAGVRCLRINAGRTLDIDYEYLSGFMNTVTSSVTVELDICTRNVDNENEAILKMCSYTLSGNPLGFEVKPMEACFMTAANTTRRDQDIMFQEGVRTHIALNIVYNLSNAGINYIRIFVNGRINREMSYANTDTFIDYVDGVKTSQGIRIGAADADIDIYGIRIYKKALSSANVMQDYQASLATVAEKLAFRDANDILGDSGAISYAKAKEKYRTMLWTGKLPYFAAPTQTNGHLNITDPEDPDHSGDLSNMTAKGQGTSSKYYWKWNQTFGFTDDSTWVDGNGVDHGACFQIAEGEPLAKKLVGKLNWASPMQSHKLGATWLYTDLWRKVVGGNSITKTEGYENCRVAVLQKSFLLFTREDENAEPVFYGLMTFGAAKGDKPTFGYDKKVFPDYLMIEGSDNGRPLSEFRIPWFEDEVTYSEDEEAYIYNNQLQWDYAMGNQDSLHYFIAATNFIFAHNTNIAPFIGTATALKADPNLDKTRHYWTTVADSNTGNAKFDLLRYDYITATWVNAGTTKSGGVVARMNLNEQCGGLASGSDWAAINDIFTNWRIADFREHIGEYVNIPDTNYSLMFCKMIAASDNWNKNTYPYIDPVTHLICWAQDDLDTIFLSDNVGRKNKPYYVEEHDTDSNGLGYWNGTGNVLFNMMEQAFPEEQRAMVKAMLSAMAELGGSVQGCMDKYFFSTQRYIPAVAYNETARLLYEEAALHIGKDYSNSTPPLTQSLGDQLQSELQWWKRREVYMSSFASYNSGHPKLTFRAITTTAGKEPTFKFVLKPHIWLYPSVASGESIYYGKGRSVPQRVKAGETITIEGLTAANDQDVLIHYANHYKSFGNFGDKSVGQIFQLAGERLVEFEATAAGAETPEFRPTGVELKAAGVKKLSIEGITTLSGTIDLSPLRGVREVSFVGTPIAGAVIPPTDTLVSYHLPATPTALSLVDFPNLADFTIEGVTNLNTLRVSGCPNINAKAIAERCRAAASPLSTVYLDNIDWTGENQLTTPVLLQYLAAVPNSTLRGHIHIARGVTFAVKQQLLLTFGNIDDANNPLYITYNMEASTDWSFTVNGEESLPTVGRYQYDVEPNITSANNFASVEWSMDINEFATIDKSTGVVSLNTLSTDSVVTIRCTVTLLDGTTKSASKQVYLYEKPAEVGDWVYADGTYSTARNARKTPIGICFYADGKDRRAVALQDVGGAQWGNSDINIILSTGETAAKDIPTLTNFSKRGLYQASDGSASNYVDNDTMRDVTENDTLDAMGFKVYTDPTYLSATYRTTNDDFGNVIPIGKNDTQKIIAFRDTLLRDANIDTEGSGYWIPTASSAKSELQDLTDKIAEMDTKLGSATAYAYFYPAASYAYAYKPTQTLKEGEVLSAKFAEHQWYLPSEGELMRLCWYHVFGDIFKDRGSLFSAFSEAYYWSSAEYLSGFAWFVGFDSGFTGSYSKSNKNMTRPVVCF